VESGFVWVNLEWPRAMKKTIARPWEMYDKSKSTQMKNKFIVKRMS
jgi:hypothetical protein